MKAATKAATAMVWKLYKYGAFALGTLVVGYLAFAVIVFGIFREEKTSFVVPLRSGFIYEYDMQDGSLNGHHLRDQSNRVVIYSDVKRFLESGDTIYGYREDLHGNPFYFICAYGEDCAATQNLTDAELRKIIAERKLSLYTSNSGTGRDDLMREMERFRKASGQKARPKWAYDEKQHRYTVAVEALSP